MNNVYENEFCHCGGQLIFHVDPYGNYDVFCSDCYDGAPDAGPQAIGTGIDKQDALEDFRENEERLLAKRNSQ
jgi:hypothetical protein